MVTHGSYTCGEQTIMYTEVELLCYTPETSVTLCVIYMQIKNFFKYTSSRMTRNFNMNDYEKEPIESRGSVNGERELGCLWLSRAF